MRTTASSQQPAFLFYRDTVSHALLDAERDRLQSEDALAQSDGAMRRDLIPLYQAPGGGWE